MTSKLINIHNLSKKYLLKNTSEVLILKDIKFELKLGDIVSIMGPSGSGKSTFLNIIGMLDSHFEGEYKFFDKNVLDINSKEKSILRNSFIGFVHQFFYLIPELNVWENIAIPKMILTNNKLEAFDSAKNLINKFGLSHRINYKPLNLSGGEQQRVSIARALINSPKILIADEMTGNLDEETSDFVFDFFIKEIRNNKQSLIFVTHNKKYANQADIKYEISKKRLIKL